MDNFNFDAEAHVYTLDGVRLPSVTEIIRPLVDYEGVKPDVLEFARVRGTAGHLTCALYDQNDLDMDTLDPQLHGYLAAWVAFTDHFHPRWGTIETPIYSKTYGVAGCPDRTGQIDFKSTIVEIKLTAELMPSTGVQLSGYDVIGEERYGLAADELWGVQLRPNGTYRYEIFPRQRATFLACRSHYLGLQGITAWKARHK